MKIHHLLLFNLLFSFFTPKLSGQTNKPCNNYDCAYKKAETFLKNKEYQKALDNLDSAEGYLTDTNTKEKEQIKQLRRRLFVAIEKEKEDAKRARDEANRQTAIANVEKTKAKVAEAKAKAVLDKISFYDGKFGLASQKNQFRQIQYGFIDKDLNTKIDFKYDEVLPFDYTGFAKVRNGNVYYLVDTMGIEYKLGMDTSQLDVSMTALDLRNKKIKEIPLSVLQYTQLEVLILGNNQINSLPTEFGQLTHLTNLNLNGNHLSSLPKELGQLTHLTSLNLSFNQLSSLPKELGQLINLTSLNLSINQLSSFPTEFENLINLTSLYLSGNKLVSLPTEFGKLTNLTSLYLNDNELSNLPPDFGQLTKLSDLNLSRNHLSSLPPEFGKLTHLISLDLSGNPIPKEEQEKIKKILPNCKIEF